MSIQADVQQATCVPGIPTAEQFRRWAQAVDCPDSTTVCIRVVGEREMRDLNQRYRDRAGTTNVLAFEADELERGQGHLGDLVICAKQVEREAQAYGRSPEARFAHITVHGLLHLLGHAHTEPGPTERMETAERAVLTRLGYPDPY